MRAGVMSTWLGVAHGLRTERRERTATHVHAVERAEAWNPEKYAREQIRGLVRQVFAVGERSARQVVISAAERETDVDELCLQVAEALAAETAKEVAVAAVEPAVGGFGVYDRGRRAALRDTGRRVKEGVWLLPLPGASRSLLHPYLSGVRREFEYSIVAAAPAGESGEALAMAEFADGIILVVSAQRTRRAAAMRIRELLDAAQVKLLGTVLSEREFPVPEGIYRRL